MRRRYALVDVFPDGPLSGNPLAVVLDSDGLTTEQMLALARWLNLSETTFLVPPTDAGADYRVRIFTLAGELPFAGHPTLGTCHAWLTAGSQPRRADVIVQECGAGLVPVRRSDRLAFAAPPLVRSGAVAEPFVNELAAVLGIGRGDVVAAQWIDNGPGWVGMLLADVDTVRGLTPDAHRYGGDEPLHIGVVGPHPVGSECAVEVRAFFSDNAGLLREDPVTGSLHASVAQWLLGTGRLGAPYVASQGSELGRRGRVHVAQDGDGTIWIGGATATIARGHVDI